MTVLIVINLILVQNTMQFFVKFTNMWSNLDMDIKDMFYLSIDGPCEVFVLIQACRCFCVHSAGESGSSRWNAEHVYKEERTDECTEAKLCMQACFYLLNKWRDLSFHSSILLSLGRSGQDQEETDFGVLPQVCLVNKQCLLLLKNVL